MAKYPTRSSIRAMSEFRSAIRRPVSRETGLAGRSRDQPGACGPNASWNGELPFHVKHALASARIRAVISAAADIVVARPIKGSTGLQW